MGQGEWLHGGFESDNPGSDLSSVRLFALPVCFLVS